jgi:hypothetical protein
VLSSGVYPLTDGGHEPETSFQRSYLALATKKTIVETTKPYTPTSATAGLPNQTMAAHIRSDAQAVAITTFEGGHLG